MLGLGVSISSSAGTSGVSVERIPQLLAEDAISATASGLVVLELQPASARIAFPDGRILAETATTLTLDFSG